MTPNNHLKQYFLTITVVICVVIMNFAVPIAAEPDLTIPSDFGKVKDKYINNYNDLLIVHIQDLHCNYDAQMSIYKIVDKLIKRDNFKLVTVEGSVGRLETAPFSNYPDEAIKDIVARHFVKTGKIDGAAYAHIMNKSSFAFWGADEPSLYKQNVGAFKGSLTSKTQNNAFCDNIKSILDNFKQKAYNKKLLNFDKQIQSYKEDKIQFNDFALYLNELIKEYKILTQDYNNFNKLVEVFNLEKQIDFAKADTQRSECIEKLSKTLEKDSLSKLLDMSLHFKTADVGAVEFYSYLKGVLDKDKKVNLENYPELEKYISYILSYNSIDHMGLFKEISSIEDVAKEKLFTRDIERQIDKLSKNIEILKNLANLKLTADTLDYYRKDRSAFLASNFTNFINENAPQYRINYKIDSSFRNIDAQLPDLEKFYSLALERDKILVDNTIDKMNQLNAKHAILVAGGFHTGGIAQSLKEKGISYVIVTPKVNELNEENNPYISVLMGEKTPFEQYLYEQVIKNKRPDPNTIVFQQEAKYLADAHKLIQGALNKEK